jgi:hypothetical protein
MSQLQEFFKFLMAQANSKDDLKKALADWVGPYHGKITLHDGVYPSPDVIYKAKSEILLGIFTGEVPFKDTMKDGSLIVIGNANESDPLANLILQVMMGAM